MKGGVCCAATLALAALQVGYADNAFHREGIAVPGWTLGPTAAVKAGGLVYTMGLTGVNMTTMALAGDDITAQATQALLNLKDLLKAAGTTVEEVMTCSLQIMDLKDFVAMNDVYRQSFPSAPPSRVAVAAKALEPSGALFEITCIAAMPGAGREVVSVPGWPAPQGVPLSMATKVNGIVFASGMQGINMSAGKMVPGGVQAETKQTLENIKQVLEAAGSSLDRVLACEVSLADIADFAAVNAVYRPYFPGSSGHLGGLPSRVAVMVGGLVGSSKVEIRCEAATSDVTGKAFSVPGWPTTMPFSSATSAQGIVYAAGVQGYFMKEGRIAPGGAGPEARQALSNLEEELKIAGSTLSSTVACDVTVKDIEQLDAVKAEITAAWPDSPPAISASVVAGLAGNGTVEIKCVAALPPSTVMPGEAAETVVV
mmetsp:Transcript_31383/g.73219  ORF Transcript_31383/g.73219 Transcript_31383/m.73219 type:complete len:427 (+) Transcript_31383:67-1347(+)